MSGPMASREELVAAVIAEARIVYLVHMNGAALVCSCPLCRAMRAMDSADLAAPDYSLPGIETRK